MVEGKQNHYRLINIGRHNCYVIVQLKVILLTSL